MSGRHQPLNGADSDQHKHLYTPALALGENGDGSAAVWTCRICDKQIRYVSEPPILPRSKQ